MMTDLLSMQAANELTSDICIIGSGAAGISLAKEFIGTSHSVVMIEAGGEDITDENQEMYHSEITGMPHLGIHDGRGRVFGGTTLLWAGQALPLFDIDFVKRSWVPFSGWPITRSSLEPFYRRAEVVLNVNSAKTIERNWPTIFFPGYDEEKINSVVSQFSPKPNFAKQYGHELKLASNITIVLHANLTSIEASNDANTIKEIRASSLNKKLLSVRSKYVVLCAGGIETPRCLLLSNSVEPCGIGNRNDVVGRFFQDHPNVRIPVFPKNKKLFNNWTNSVRKSQIRYSIKMLPSEAVMQRHQILNVGAEVFYPPDENDALVASKLLLASLRDPRKRRHLLPSIKRVVGDPVKVIAAAYNYYVRGQPASVGRTPPHLDFFCEQQPNPSSRVKLSNDKDCLGLNKVQLDWKLCEAEENTIRIFHNVIREEWQRLGIGGFDCPPDVTPGIDPLRQFKDYNHHLGTCRMGNDPTTSVVDSDCKVHGYNNLYVGSSAVFPTGGCSNPTLTIIALSLRIADHIKDKLKTECDLPNIVLAEQTVMV